MAIESERIFSRHIWSLLYIRCHGEILRTRYDSKAYIALAGMQGTVKEFFAGSAGTGGNRLYLVMKVENT